jgi:hypothetical protein
MENTIELTEVKINTDDKRQQDEKQRDDDKVDADPLPIKHEGIRDTKKGVVYDNEEETRSVPCIKCYPCGTGEEKFKCFCRVFLFLSLFSLFLPFISEFGLEYLHTEYYTIPVSIYSGMLAFYVMPCLTDYLHKKELDIRDLIRERGLDKDDRISQRKLKTLTPHQSTYLYIRIYRYLLCFSSSILFGILVQYLEYDIQKTTLSYIEVTAVGLSYISIFRKIQQLISTALLAFLYRVQYRCRIPSSTNALSALARA